MRVRVKSESNPVFYGTKLYIKGEEFTIKERKIQVNGKEKILSVKQQFSDIAMEEVKPKEVVEEEAVKDIQEARGPANKPKPLGKPKKK